MLRPVEVGRAGAEQLQLGTFRREELRLLGVVGHVERFDAVETVGRRSGSELDPQVAEAFLSRAPELLTALAAPSVWEAFLAAEPPPFEVDAGDEHFAACWKAAS